MFTSFISGSSFLLIAVFFNFSFLKKLHFVNVTSVSSGILNLQVVKQTTQTGLNSRRNSLGLHIDSPQAGFIQRLKSQEGDIILLSLSLDFMPLLPDFGFFLSSANFCYLGPTQSSRKEWNERKESGNNNNHG